MGMSSGSVKRLVRKLCTSGRVDGPPMLNMAMAVGAFLAAARTAIVQVELLGAAALDRGVN